MNAARNLGRSGVLAEETNLKNGVLLRHTIPPDARLPDRPWKLFIFDDERDTPPITIGFQKAYLIGQDTRVADIPLEHKTVAPQHAVICFRINRKKRDTVCPYLIDLEAPNGTFINGERMEPLRYYELLDQDLITIGNIPQDLVVMEDADSSERAAVDATELLESIQRELEAERAKCQRKVLDS